MARPGDNCTEHDLPYDTCRFCLQDELRQAEKERDLLADAIHKAAVKRGIIQGGTPLSGPQLLMLCEQLGS